MSKNKKVHLPKWFVTSDWHLGYFKSIGYDKRPFEDLDHMHKVLVNNYNASVGPKDTCFFLGDVGWKDLVIELVPKLNGTKVLILGNHDQSKTMLRDAGFSVILNAGMITIGDALITMTHCPLRAVFREGPVNQDGEPMKNFRPFESWHGESRYEEFSLPDFGQFHLHGHTHKRKGNDVVSGRQWDIGVVGNGYRPVSMSQIESWIALYRRDKNG